MFNEKQLKQLAEQNKIRSFDIAPVKRLQVVKDSNTKPRKDLPVIPNAAKRSEEKSWIEWNLLFFCNTQSLELVQEYHFDQERRFRFDWYIPALKLGIEYNGGAFMDKACHNTGKQLSRDYTKNNLATVRGFRVLSYNCVTYKNVINDLREILK